MARPRKQIDVVRLEALASRYCSDEEMASDLGVSVDTLTRRYAEPIKRGKDRAKISLRSKQFEAAMGKPAVPAVYLREHQEKDGTQHGELVLREGKPILLQDEQEAVKPNITMLIWLGKQYLEQSDKVEFPGSGEGFEFVK